MRKLTLLFSLCTFGLAAADMVTMKNGDRVSGAIVKKDGATLTIKSTHFGVVTLPWAEVESVKADQALNVVLPGDKIVQGTLETQGDKVRVAAQGATQTVAPGEIVALRDAAEQAAYERLLHPGIGDLWAISGGINFAGTSGNAKTFTFTTPLNFVRASNTSKTTAYFNSIRASATVNGRSAPTAQAVRGGWAFNRNISKRTFFNTFNDYEYDKFQDLDLRVVLGAGLGYMAWKGERGRFDVVGGMAWNHERFGPPAPKLAFRRNGADAYWGDDFTYKLSARTNFYQSFRMFNNVTNSDRYRVNFDMGATTQLTKWLTWNIAFSDRFLNVPAPGRKKNDLLYTTGFGFTFAR